MKKLIFGAAMMLTGCISIAILCAGAISSQFTVNGSNHFLDIWRLFGVTPLAAAFAIIAALGLAFSISGLIKTNEK